MLSVGGMPAPESVNTDGERLFNAYAESLRTGAAHALKIPQTTEQAVLAFNAGVPGAFQVRSSEIRVLRTLDRIFQANRFSEVLAISGRNPDKLDEMQMLQLTAAYGHALARQYESARAGRGSPEGRGIVAPDEMFQKLKINLGSGNFSPGRSPPPELQAGVCRDIAVPMAQMLDARFGKGSAHLLAYRTPKAAHIIVLAETPGQPGSLFQLNYGKIRQIALDDGGRALHWEGSFANEVSARGFRIFDADGKPVLLVPSELQKLTHAAMGLDITELDPLARSRHNLLTTAVAVDLSPAIRGLELELRASHGSLWNEQSLSGFAATLQWSPHPIFRSQATGFTGHFSRPRAPQEPENQTAYLEASQNQAVFVQTLEPLKVTLGGTGGDLRLNLEWIRETAQSTFEGAKGSASHQDSFRAALNWESENSKQSAGIGALLALMPSDVRLMNGLKVERTLILNGVYIRGAAIVPLGSNIQGGLHTTVVGDPLGARGSIGASLQVESCKASLTLSGRIANAAEAGTLGLLQDSSLPRGDIDIICEVDSGWTLHLRAYDSRIKPYRRWAP